MGNKTKKLRIKPNRIILQDDSGQNDELFGIWEKRKDTENVEEYIRNMRKSKKIISNDSN